MAENRKIFKRIASREYWSKCNVLAILYRWIRLDKFYEQWIFFLNSKSFFELTTIFSK